MADKKRGSMLVEEKSGGDTSKNLTSSAVDNQKIQS